jgi:hypothetical protein
MLDNDDRKTVANNTDWELILKGGPALIIDGETPFEIWQEIGTKLNFIEKYIQFKLGDWLNFGAGVYGEKHAQAIEETGYESKTLRNYAWICGKVAPEARNAKLSFNHHALVAKFDSFIQIEELTHAESESMSVEDFRHYLRGKYGVSEEKKNKDGGKNEPKDPEETIDRVLEIIRERKVKALPSKEDVAWMMGALKSIENVCLASKE